jgi:membrane associated rhomboid family serine protease
MNKVMLFAAGISTLDVLLFLALPGGQLVLDLGRVGQQPLMLLAFPFVHFDVMHLAENVVGLMVTAILAFELDVNVKWFALAFAAGVAAAIPLSAAFHGEAVAGSSTGIFATLGVVLQKAKAYVTPFITVPLFIVFMFAQSAASWLSCAGCAIGPFKTGVFHFGGFAVGGITQLAPKPAAKRMIREVN